MPRTTSIVGMLRIIKVLVGAGIVVPTFACTSNARDGGVVTDGAGASSDSGTPSDAGICVLQENGDCDSTIAGAECCALTAVLLRPGATCAIPPHGRNNLTYVCIDGPGDNSRNDQCVPAVDL